MDKAGLDAAMEREVEVTLGLAGRPAPYLKPQRVVVKLGGARYLAFLAPIAGAVDTILIRYGVRTIATPAQEGLQRFSAKSILLLRLDWIEVE